MELEEAANKRFFVTAGYFSNKEIAEVIEKNFPELWQGLPGPQTKGGDYPKEGVYEYDNSRAVNILGLKWRSLESSIADTVKSLQAIE